MVQYCTVEGPRKSFTQMETERATGQMKRGKASGTTHLVGRIIGEAGQAREKKMTKICDMVIDEGNVWSDREFSILIWIYMEKMILWYVGLIKIVYIIRTLLKK